jgi:hypothetical protein
MKRAPSIKAMERRKRPRSAAKTSTKATKPTQAHAHQTRSKIKLVDQQEAIGLPTSSRSAGPQIAVENEEHCQSCSKTLIAEDRALFVEEEVGRIFCSENCITTFFSPEIERLEKEYHRRVHSNDLTPSERESYSHLRWITLQEPDEIWREKTLSGDFRYTLISEFQPGAKGIWCICISLFLKGEPSFLYLAFTTRNASMVNAYRRGERVEWAKPKGESDSEVSDGLDTAAGTDSAEIVESPLSDRLADEWTEDETFLAQVNQERRDDDIGVEEFASYEKCLEETLETPDEVWSCQLGKSSVKLYHFMRHYKADLDAEEGTGYWYLIVARETDDDEQIEILDAFPTRDAMLVDRYRRGEQEVGYTTPGPTARVVH